MGLYRVSITLQLLTVVDLQQWGDIFLGAMHQGLEGFKIDLNGTVMTATAVISALSAVVAFSDFYTALLEATVSVPFMHKTGDFTLTVLETPATNPAANLAILEGGQTVS